MKATVFHNPRCSKSRQALDLVNQAGAEVTVVEYLKDPPSKAELAKLIADAGLAPRDAARRKDALYKELGLDNPDLSDDEVIGIMADNPAVIERPFVVTDKGTRLARPTELVNDIL